MNTQCRICLSHNTYREIGKEYFYCGRSENYGEMIVKTFNIGKLDSRYKRICNRCIEALRQATEFKHTIIRSDKYLTGSPDYDDVEINMSDYELDNNMDDTGINEYSIHPATIQISYTGLDNIQISDIRQEVPYDVEPSNVNEAENYNQGERRDAATIILSDEENSTNNEVSDVIELDEEKVTSSTNVEDGNKTEDSLQTSSQDRDNGPITSKETLLPKKASEKYSERVRDMQVNTHNLIVNSNLCLFKSLRTKYGCCECKESFFNIKELRQHIPSHFDSKDLKLKCQRLTGMSYENADITNLECKQCGEKCFDLDILKSHLEGHGLKFTSDGNFLISYKVEEALQCLICQNSFNTFTRLAMHMNSHSTDNVCEICSKSFFNSKNLRTHIFSQHTDKKCSKCSMVFKKVFDRTKHMRRVHGKSGSKRHCLRCKSTFKYTHQLLQHNVEAHGAETQEIFCQRCGKKYASEVNLKIHIKSVHLKERNYQCSLCVRKFFTKTDKTRHEKTHSDDRPFSCGICVATFKTKESVKRHLKLLHGHLIKTDNINEKVVNIVPE